MPRRVAGRGLPLGATYCSLKANSFTVIWYFSGLVESSGQQHVGDIHAVLINGDQRHVIHRSPQVGELQTACGSELDVVTPVTLFITLGLNWFSPDLVNGLVKGGFLKVQWAHPPS